MKPLPFDMTPLAHSLSLVPAVQPRADISAPATSAAPTAEMRAVEMDLEDVLIDPDSGIESVEIEEPVVEEAPAAEVNEVIESKPRKAKRRKEESKAKRRAEKAKRNVPAERPQSTPATELRTAIFPGHVCSEKSWAARLAAEQIHALATHVLARHAQQNLRTLAVTSALAGEGKTTVTLALAEKLACADKRILILDLDTHRATLSREAGLEDAAGALQSSDPREIENLEFHAYATDVPGVTIMPVGYQAEDAMGPPLLSPVHIGVLVLNALENYDIVLLDCPPLLPVAETFVLREVVDSAIMVVRAGSTPRDVIDQAIDDFGREKFMGAILNRTKPGDIPYFREVYGYYRRDSSRR